MGLFNDFTRGATYLPYRLLGGPVDMSAMALNAARSAAGLPQPQGNAIGGSDWMIEQAAKRGLLQAPTGDPAEVAGDVVSGLLNPAAAAARRIQGLHELDGLEFVVRVDIEKDNKGQDRNVVKVAVEPDHPEYARVKGVASKATSGGATSGAPAQPVPSQAAAAPRPAVTGKPSWAQ